MANPTPETDESSRTAAAKTAAEEAQERNETLLRVFTDRKRAELALRESEEKFRLMTETITEVFWMVDATFRKSLYVSPAHEVLLGYSRRGVQDDPRTLADLIHKDDRQAAVALVEQNAARGLPFEHEYRIVRMDGEIRWILERGFPVRETDGKVTRYVGVSRDITAQKLAATELRNQKAALEQKNIALREILAQIETERMETRKRVTANMEKFVTPILKKMRLGASPRDRKYLDMLELRLKDIMSPFGLRISGRHSLSARETEICNLIRSGLASKEMAQMLSVSPRTVDTFRNRIRKKLGISSKDVNLYAHLQTLADDWPAAAPFPVRTRRRRLTGPSSRRRSAKPEPNTP